MKFGTHATLPWQNKCQKCHIILQNKKNYYDAIKWVFLHPIFFWFTFMCNNILRIVPKYQGKMTNDILNRVKVFKKKNEYINKRYALSHKKQISLNTFCK